MSDILAFRGSKLKLLSNRQRSIKVYLNWYAWKSDSGLMCIKKRMKFQNNHNKNKTKQPKEMLALRFKQMKWNCEFFLSAKIQALQCALHSTYDFNELELWLETKIFIIFDQSILDCMLPVKVFLIALVN